MLLQNVDDFKELEQEIYKIVCETVRKKLKETLELIDEAIMGNRDKDVYQTYAYVSELEKDFGFKPSTGLEEGLNHYAKWYKAYYKVEK